MKSDVHPDYNPVVFKDGEHEIVTRSTATSERTREIDGVEHYVISIDISAFSHPFYTGQKKLVDTEGRVDRFFDRYDLDKPDEDDEDDSDRQPQDDVDSEDQGGPDDEESASSEDAPVQESEDEESDD